MLSAEHLRSITLRGLGRRAMVGTAGAVVGVIGCFLVASFTGTPLTVAVREAAATPVPLGAAVVATVAAGGAAYVLARLAGRTARPRRIFLLLTTAGLLASAIPPLLAGTTVATTIWLLIMHAVAAVAVVPVLASGLPTVRPARQGVDRDVVSQIARSAPVQGAP